MNNQERMVLIGMAMAEMGILWSTAKLLKDKELEDLTKLMHAHIDLTYPGLIKEWAQSGVRPNDEQTKKMKKKALKGINDFLKSNPRGKWPTEPDYDDVE